MVHIKQVQLLRNWLSIILVESFILAYPDYLYYLTLDVSYRPKFAIMRLSCVGSAKHMSDSVQTNFIICRSTENISQLAELHGVKVLMAGILLMSLAINCNNLWMFCVENWDLYNLASKFYLSATHNHGVLVKINGLTRKMGK